LQLRKNQLTPDTVMRFDGLQIIKSSI